MQTLKYTAFWSLLICLTALAGRYDQWLQLPPASIHQWRQADGAAIAWHYARNPDFFSVEQFNLFRHGDSHAVGELPLIYWLSGLIARSFGNPDIILRYISLVVSLAGLWAFGWLLLKLCKKPILAALGTGVLATSPIIAYYGPSHLPDMPAFGFALMMAAFLYKAEEQQRPGWLVMAALGAALAMSLKLSMTIAPVSLSMAWIYGKYKSVWPKGTIWNTGWPIVSMAVAFVPVMVCRYWILNYNAAHHAYYFFADIRPVWWYGWPAIREILQGALLFTLPAYASTGLFLAAGVSLCFWAVKRKSINFFWNKCLLLLGLGCFAFVLLWFRMFREHDYYAICLLVLPAGLLAAALHYLPQFYSYPKLVLLFAIFWAIGLAHCHLLLQKRLELAYKPYTQHNLPPSAFLSEATLTKAGIGPAARFLCPEDPSPNVFLFALKRYGWTAYNFGESIPLDTLQYYQSNFQMSHLALRDTASYNLVYRSFFGRKLLEVEGWYVFGVGR